MAKTPQKKRIAHPKEDSMPIGLIADLNLSQGGLKKNGIAALFLFLLGLLLFANTWKHDYALDDVGAITTNLFVKKGISGIPEILTMDLWHFENVNLGYFRPLSLVTFAVEYEFFGPNPHVSHIINTILFGLTLIVVFSLLRNLFRNLHPSFSFLAVLLFAAHPIHTEVVANIKSRDEILSFLNLGISLLCFLKFSSTGKKFIMIPGIVFCYLAMLSKETALIGIILGPAMIFAAGKNKLKEILWVTGGIILAMGIFFYQKKIMLGNVSGEIPDDMVNYPYQDPDQRIPTAFLFLGMMFNLLIIPLWLKYDYSFNAVPSGTWSDPMVLFGLMIFLALIGYIIYDPRKRDPLRISAFCFLVCAAPVMAFVYLRGGIFAERLLFSPSLWFSSALVIVSGKIFRINFKNTSEGLFKALKRCWKPAAVVLLFFTFFAGKTILRNPAWRDNFTLFSTDISNNQNSSQNHRHLGSEFINKAMIEKDSLKRKEYFDAGTAELKKGLAIYPRLGDAFLKLGVAYHTVYFNADSAEKYYLLAIEVAPGMAIAYNNMGSLYSRQGKLELASYYFNRSVEVNPNFEDGKKNAAALKASSGLDIHLLPMNIDVDSLSKSPVVKDDKYFYNIGTIFASKGQYQDAIEQFKIAAEKNPRNEDVYINMGNCYGILGKFKESIDCSLFVLSLNPLNQRALQNLSVSYENMGEKAKAREAREKLEKLQAK